MTDDGERRGYIFQNAVNITPESPFPATIRLSFPRALAYDHNLQPPRGYGYLHVTVKLSLSCLPISRRPHFGGVFRSTIEVGEIKGKFKLFDPRRLFAAELGPSFQSLRLFSCAVYRNLAILSSPRFCSSVCLANIGQSFF